MRILLFYNEILNVENLGESLEKIENFIVAETKFNVLIKKNKSTQKAQEKVLSSFMINLTVSINISNFIVCRPNSEEEKCAASC